MSVLGQCAQGAINSLYSMRWSNAISFGLMHYPCFLMYGISMLISSLRGQEKEGLARMSQIRLLSYVTEPLENHWTLNAGMRQGLSAESSCMHR